MISIAIDGSAGAGKSSIFFRYTNGYRSKWLSEFEGLIESKL